jgi:N-acetylmuramoyl-L-alanine amidase
MLISIDPSITGSVAKRFFSSLLFARLIPLLFLGISCDRLCTGRETENLETVAKGGERYVTLQKWARAKGFKVNWDGNGKDLLVTNSWARLEFTINSKRASINGTEVWLSSALLATGPTLFIGERDIYKLLHPILFPQKTKKKLRTIIIAPGHGGKDPGYQLDSQQEKKFCLLMADALKETLQSAGFKVILTRSSDVFVDVEDQAAMANKANADLFIALHYNAAPIVEAKGIETYCLTPGGAISTNGGSPMPSSPGHKYDTMNILLAYQIQKSLLKNTDFADRGIRRAGFMMLRKIKMPGVLIEGGFLSNHSDSEKIHSASYRRKVADAITDGVLRYKRVIEYR